VLSEGQSRDKCTPRQLRLVQMALPALATDIQTVKRSVAEAVSGTGRVPAKAARTAKQSRPARSMLPLSELPSPSKAALVPAGCAFCLHLPQCANSQCATCVCTPPGVKLFQKRTA
jgi:hypothetical protein